MVRNDSVKKRYRRRAIRRWDSEGVETRGRLQGFTVGFNMGWKARRRRMRMNMSNEEKGAPQLGKRDEEIINQLVEDYELCPMISFPSDPYENKGDCMHGGGECSSKWDVDTFKSCIHFKDFLINLRSEALPLMKKARAEGHDEGVREERKRIFQELEKSKRMITTYFTRDIWIVEWKNIEKLKSGNRGNLEKVVESPELPLSVITKSETSKDVPADRLVKTLTQAFEFAENPKEGVAWLTCENNDCCHIWSSYRNVTGKVVSYETPRCPKCGWGSGIEDVMGLLRNRRERIRKEREKSRDIGIRKG